VVTLARLPAGGDVSGKAVISLTTGLEDPEKVTVAFLVAVGAAERGRPTLMFLTKEAVRLALDGVAQGVACEGCPPPPQLAPSATPKPAAST
jgi:predicted peroxiredoxin